MWVEFPPSSRTYYSRSPIPGVPYGLQPNIDELYPPGLIATNSDGLRTRHKPDKADDVIRILTIGDSITFGFGVDQLQAYPQQLEAVLNERNENPRIRYEVINAGVSGYNVVDEVAVIKYLVPKYRPDFIVWLIVGNDWDDSLNVNPAGIIDSTHPEYIASSNFLRFAWGSRDSFAYHDNFYQSMDARHQHWAKNKVYKRSPFEKLESIIKKWSYFYSFIRSRALKLSSTVNFVRGDDFDEAIYKQIFVSNKGMPDVLPSPSSIRLSPNHRQRFHNAINEGIATGNAASTPIVVYGLGIPLELKDITNCLICEDVSQYFGMPLRSFRQKYNLGWNSHFDATGNRILAESIVQSLIKNGLLTRIETITTKFYDKSWYWLQYEKLRKAYVDKYISTYVNFQEFENIHQVIGGIYPPRTFPTKKGGSLSLILKGNRSPLHIVGNNLTNNLQEILINVGMEEGRHIIALPPGHFTKIVHLTGDGKKNISGEIIEVRLSSLSDPVNIIQISYIGFKG
jgi:hypothetical protein